MYKGADGKQNEKAARGMKQRSACGAVLKYEYKHYHHHEYNKNINTKTNKRINSQTHHTHTNKTKQVKHLATKIHENTNNKERTQT